MVGDVALDGTVIVDVPDADIPPPKLVLARSAGLSAEDAAHNLFRTLSDRTAWHDHLERRYGPGVVKAVPEVV
jgi:hypothetical protein